jgi:hypothetical protein
VQSPSCSQNALVGELLEAVVDFDQVARLQRQRQDQGTFFDKRMAEQKTDLERAQEHKLAEQQKAIYGESDERINATIPGLEKAVHASGVCYER